MPDLDNLNRFEKEEFKKHLYITWTYNSNAIEGNSLTYQETQFVIEEGLTIKGKPLKDHNEVIGHQKAVDLIYKLVEKDRISQDDLFLLHKAVQTNVVVDIECPIGAYKVVENGRYLRVDGKLEYYPYPHPNDIGYLMDLWFEKYATTDKPDDFEGCVDIYTDIHISFTSIHPFFDGNGRLARLIANIPLIKSGFLPIIIDATKREDYLRLLAAYNMSVKPLDSSATALVEKNEAYQKLRAFFKSQYQNSQDLLDSILRSKR